MRRKRSLTPNERWELGLFLAMMIVGCLCVTVLLNLNSIPRLFAVFGSPSVSGETVPSRLGASNHSPAFPQPAFAFDLNPPTFPSINGLAPAPFPAFSTPALVAPSQDAPETPRARLATIHLTPETKIFRGHKYRLDRTLRLRVTAYAADIRCTWPYPGTTTASGLSVKTNHGRLVAADTQIIPMHALVSVPGYSEGSPVPVLDRGGAIKGRRLDLLMPTFDQAKEWGTKTLEVKIYLPVSTD